jgi:hypothetical protein
MLALSAILQYLPGNAQQTTADKIEGTWKGTSICQQKQSACHDENVVHGTLTINENTLFRIAELKKS